MRKKAAILIAVALLAAAMIWMLWPRAEDEIPPEIAPSVGNPDVDPN